MHIPLDKSSQQPKGLAYITFRSPQAAVDAYDALDGRTLQGRLLHILPAVGRLAKVRPDLTQSSLKSERLEARKQTGGKAFSWATLYLNVRFVLASSTPRLLRKLTHLVRQQSNAALAAVADRLGVSKSALLDPSAPDPAIKVALAEAHTIGEIKQFFEGVRTILDLSRL